MKKNYIKPILAIGLVACMAFAGISAYFSDADTMDNEFTVGKVSLDLMETLYRQGVEGYDSNTDILPLQEIPRNPQIYNNGKNPEYVFMSVTIPTANVRTNNYDGTVNDAELIELFSYKTNEGWVELKSAKTTTSNSITHVYAYADDNTLTPLEVEKITTSLFDYIKFADIKEDEGLELSAWDVVINAYGIQTDNIAESTVYEGDNKDGIASILETWNIVKKSNPKLTKVGLTEHPFSDMIIGGKNEHSGDALNDSLQIPDLDYIASVQTFRPISALEGHAYFCPVLKNIDGVECTFINNNTGWTLTENYHTGLNELDHYHAIACSPMLVCNEGDLMTVIVKGYITINEQNYVVSTSTFSVYA